MKEGHEEDPSLSSSPSSWTLGLSLLFAVTMCSSAGVVFDILTTTKGTPPFLAAFWRLFVQNVVQFVPFILSLWKYWHEDKDKISQGEEGQVQGEKQSLIETPPPSSSSVPASASALNHLLMPRYVSSLPLCAISGFFLGVHFSMWVYSMRYTSLTHSLLWVSMGPIIINGSTWLLYMMKSLTVRTCICAGFLSIMGIGMSAQSSASSSPSSSSHKNRQGRLLTLLSKVQRPSALETFGAIFGIIGAMIMLLGVRRIHEELEVSGAMNDNDAEHLIMVNNGDDSQNHPHEPTIYGDVAAFSGAVAVCVYLVIGRNVRSFLPIWLYVFPVIGFASLTCLVFFLCDYYTTIATNDAEEEVIGIQSVWDSILGFTDISILPYVIYLGVGPGICGHTLLNTLLKYVSPLIVSTAMLAEPILGSIIGYMVGLQPLPGVYTWIGGSVLMVGLVLVVSGESSNDQTENDDIDNGIGAEPKVCSEGDRSDHEQI